MSDDDQTVAAPKRNTGNDLTISTWHIVLAFLNITTMREIARLRRTSKTLQDAVINFSPPAAWRRVIRADEVLQCAKANDYNTLSLCIEMRLSRGTWPLALLWALRNGRKIPAQILLDRTANTPVDVVCQSSGRTTLHFAALLEEEELVLPIIRQAGGTIRQMIEHPAGPERLTPLTELCSSGRSRNFSSSGFRLSTGPTEQDERREEVARLRHINSRPRQERAASQVACAKLLIERAGAAITPEAVVRAAEAGKAALVDFLCSHPRAPRKDLASTATFKGQSAVLAALRGCHADTLRVLMKHGATFNLTTAGNEEEELLSKDRCLTLLEEAAACGNIETVNFMLEKIMEGNPAQVAKTFDGAIVAAAMYGQFDAARHLLRVAEKSSISNDNNNSVLSSSALHNAVNRDGVTLLMAAAGGEVYSRKQAETETGTTAANSPEKMSNEEEAARVRQLEFELNDIDDNNDDADTKQYKRALAAVVAAEQEQKRCAFIEDEILSKLPASSKASTINAQLTNPVAVMLSRPRNALAAATAAGRVSVVLLLLRHGASPDDTNNRGIIGLAIKRHTNRSDDAGQQLCQLLTWLLIQHGAQPTVEDAIEAIAVDRVDVFDLMLRKQRANPQEEQPQSQEQQTSQQHLLLDPHNEPRLLSESITRSAVACVTLLLRKYKVNPDTIVNSDEGETALHSAVSVARSPIVELLLDAGASLSVLNRNACTVLHTLILRRPMAIRERPDNRLSPQESERNDHGEKILSLLLATAVARKHIGALTTTTFDLINAREGASGNTAVMLLCQKDAPSQSLVDKIVNHGANLRLQRSDGDTVFHILGRKAKMAGCTRTRPLLEHLVNECLGNSVNVTRAAVLCDIKNNAGQSAAELIREANNAALNARLGLDEKRRDDPSAMTIAEAKAMLHKNLFERK